MASLFRFKFNDDIYTETGRTYNALLKRYGKGNVIFLGKTDKFIKSINPDNPFLARKSLFTL